MTCLEAVLAGAQQRHSPAWENAGKSVPASENQTMLMNCARMNPCSYICIHVLNESDRTFEPQITAATRLPR